MTLRSLPLIRQDCPAGTCPHVSCRHHYAVYRLLLNGSIAWHPTIGREPERLTDDELASRIERLPYGGCSLRAADLGGLHDGKIADALGLSRQAIELIDAERRFRVAASRLGIDLR